MSLALVQEAPLIVRPTLDFTLDPSFDDRRPAQPSRAHPPSTFPDYARMRSDALSWQRTRGDANEWQHQHESYLRYLDAFAGGQLDGVDTARPDVLLARAVVYFSDRYPTGEEHREMLTIHSVIGTNLYDLALAWAVGWNPLRAPRPAVHVASTEPALYALIEQAASSIAVSARLLSERAGLAVVEREEHGSLAAMFGMSLTGRCDCGHHVRGCTGCGRTCCFADHDLRTWDPYRCHFRPFVDQAVRGTAQRRIMGGAFAASMLFRALEREGKLLCRTVEWGRCDVCDRAFEGLHCPEPHPRQTGPVRREPRKNQLIQPATADGGHLPLQRWWCAECHHLFGAAGARETDVASCPRCERRPNRRMTVWARITPSRSAIG